MNGVTNKTMDHLSLRQEKTPFLSAELTVETG